MLRLMLAAITVGSVGSTGRHRKPFIADRGVNAKNASRVVLDRTVPENGEDSVLRLFRTGDER
jgi:hypothetical protein